MTKQRRKSKRRGLFNKRLTPDEQAAQREAAFEAIRRLYGEALPLWRFCPSGYCRRHQVCIGDVRSCLESRQWPAAIERPLKAKRRHWVAHSIISLAPEW